jgi:Flp pilus assembly protein CpaB
MRRYGWIGGTLVIVILLVVIEMTIISNASGYEAKQKVVFAARDIKKDALITEEMLEIREISSEAVHKDAVRNISDASNMYAASSICSGEMLLKSRLTAEAPDRIEALDKSKRLFCAKMEFDQANAWQLEKDQHVDIIYIPNHGERNEDVPEAAGVLSMYPAESGVKLIKAVRVAGLIDEKGKPAGDGSDEMPRYILFEVTEEQAVFLAFAKRYGRLELSSIPDKDEQQR